MMTSHALDSQQTVREHSRLSSTVCLLVTLLYDSLTLCSPPPPRPQKYRSIEDYVIDLINTLVYSEASQCTWARALVK